MNSIIEKLQSLPDEEKKTDIWRTSKAIALDNGTAYYDEMYEAINYYLYLGFTPEEICEQVNLGSLSVNADEIKEIFDIK